MSKAVETAQDWVKLMVQRESRGAGDRINAMRRLANRYGVPYSTIWNLTYRPPRDLWVTVYEKLEAAYHAEIRRAVSVLEHERALYEARTKVGEGLVSVADLLDREET